MDARSSPARDDGGDTDATTIGERFARALAMKDFDALAALLHPDVDFKGMTPSRFWEAHSPAEVIDGSSVCGSRTPTTSTGCSTSRPA